MSAPRILLIVGGGIAAYKACELIRLIRGGGGEVTCVLTDGGAKFITALTLAALSENPVHTSLWDLKAETEIGHIQLSRQADLVVVCPATADLLAKMAAGIADDMATTLLLATDKPVMAVPAMNVRMWEHPATVRNVATLVEMGVAVLDPDEGMMACGEYGPGRLPDPPAIWLAIRQLLGLADTFEAAPAADEPSFGGLSAATILRNPERALPLLDAQAMPAVHSEPVAPPADWPAEEIADEDLPPVAEVVPPLNMDSPLLVKKGKARAAPPTDPEALNHLVSRHGEAAAPEPFAGEPAAAPVGLEAAPAAAELMPDPLDGQPDFAEEPAHRPLFGKHLVITAGPTWEALDPVRFLANRSSGKQGFAIAAAAAAAGARVTLVAGPVCLDTPPGVDRVDVESARDMAGAVKAALPADAAVMVAAVADWRPAQHSDSKIKKRGSAPPALRLTENPDILATVAGSTDRPRLLIGFAAETNDVLAHAKEKRTRKGADWIVANDVSGDVMGGARNAVHIITADGIESLPDMPKEMVAAALVERIADALGG